MPDNHDAAETEPRGEDVTGSHGHHEALDGAPLHPLIDLSRDPTPGEPDHALPEDD